jgi:hypothetical protein
MRKTLALMAMLVLLSPLAAHAQGVTLDGVSAALGAANLKSISVTATGSIFAVGQSAAAGGPWPKFNFKSYTRSLNYETASAREEHVRVRAEDPPRAGGIPAIGESRQILLLSGDQPGTWSRTRRRRRRLLWPSGSSSSGPRHTASSRRR